MFVKSHIYYFIEIDQSQTTVVDFSIFCLVAFLGDRFSKPEFYQYVAFLKCIDNIFWRLTFRSR